MRLVVAAVAALLAVPAAGAVRPIVTHVAAPVDGTAAIEVTVLNDGATATRFEVAVRVAARLRDAAGERAVALTRAADQPAAVTIAAGGFVRLAYRAAWPPASAGAALTVPDWGAEGLALAPPGSPASPPPPQVAAAGPDPDTYTIRYRSADGDRGNAFLPNLTAYEPVYAVYGPGTDSDARLQISFKYQLFGDARDADRRWIDGLHFAFTQRLYWNLGQESSPFRNVDYLPELFYLWPARPVSDRLSLGGQAGFRHESNGRGGTASRSYNTLYVQPYASLPVGDYRLTVAPRLWVYVGNRDDNPDIRRYRGNTGVTVEIGRDDGLRVTTQGRIDVGSGRGALDTLVSYPLDVVVARNLKLYAFGQGFVGYGENLLDYRRHQTRLRVGIGIVR